MKRLLSTFYALLAFCVIFFATACTNEASSPTLIMPTANVTNAVTTNTPAATEIPLSATGPWLVFTDNYRLYAANKDGTGLTALVPQLSVVEIKESPSANLVAVLTFKNNEPFYTIALINLPQGDIVHEISLLSFYADKQVNLDDGPAGPLGGVRNIQWSPDGRYLAFMGAIEGPTSSLYVYDTKSQIVKRLSDNQYQAANPNWSPDGKYIVFEEISSFHGWITEGVWTASIESNESRILYKPARHVDQEVLGWQENNIFLVAERNIGLGEGNVLIVNAETGNVKSLYPDYFFPFTTDKKGTIVFFPIDHEVSGLAPGLYMISPNISEPKILIEASSTDPFKPILLWDSSTESFVSEFPCGNELEKVTAFDLSGNSICIEKPISNLSPNGAWYRVENEQLNVFQSNGEKTGELTENYEIIFWNPDSSGLFAATKNEIHYISLSDMNPQNIYKSEEEYPYFDFVWAGLSH